MVSQKLNQVVKSTNSIKGNNNTNVTAEQFTLSRSKLATMERNEFMPIKALGGKMYNNEVDN